MPTNFRNLNNTEIAHEWNDGSKASLPQKQITLAPEVINALAVCINPQMDATNKQLAKEVEELRPYKEKYEKLKDACADQSIELRECKKKLIEAQKVIKNYENNEPPHAIEPLFEYQYNLLDFEENASTEDVFLMFNNLHLLVKEKTDEDSYLIDSASAVIPIYIMLTKATSIEKTKWHFCGTFTTFCEYWNNNIVKYIEDEERAILLHCNYTSLKAELNKALWKNSRPATWRNLVLENNRHKKVLNRAYNIKGRMEYLFK